MLDRTNNASSETLIEFAKDTRSKQYYGAYHPRLDSNAGILLGAATLEGCDYFAKVTFISVRKAASSRDLPEVYPRCRHFATLSSSSVAGPMLQQRKSTAASAFLWAAEPRVCSKKSRWCLPKDLERARRLGVETSTLRTYAEHFYCSGRLYRILLSGRQLSLVLP